MYDFNYSFEKCKELLDDLRIPYAVNTSIDATDKELFGDLGMTRKNNNSFLILINKLLLSERLPEQMLERTIIHELLHTCEGCWDHGAKWKQYANIVNKNTDYALCTTCTSEEAALFDKAYAQTTGKKLYTVKCVNCDYSRSYIRRCSVVNHPEEYKCPCCGEDLYLVNKT